MLIAIWFIGLAMCWMFILLRFNLVGYWIVSTFISMITIWSAIIFGYWLLTNFGGI